MKLARILGRIAKGFGITQDDLFQNHTITINRNSGNVNITNPYAQSAWVHRCANAIAKPLSNTPWRILTGPEDDPTEVTDSRILKLFDDPNPRDRSTVRLYEATQLFLSLQGTCLWVMPRDNVSQFPEIIFPVGPVGWKPIKSKDGLTIKEWVFQGKKRITYQPHEVLLFTQFNPNGGVFGLSSVQAALSAISADIRGLATQDALLQNNAIPGGLLSTDMPLQKEQAEQILKMFNSTHKGSNKAGKTAIVHSGIKYQVIQVPTKDLALIEIHNSTREDIAAAFDVPFEIAGFGMATFTNYPMAAKVFWRNTITPIQKYISETVTEGLLEPLSNGAWRWEFDRRNVPELQEDITEKVAQAKTLWDMGTPLSLAMETVGINMELEDVAGAETGFLPFSLTPLEAEAALIDEGADPLEPSILEPVESTEQDVEVTAEAVLNGAQITAATSIVSQVALGELPRDAGIGQLQVLFNLSLEQAEQIMGSAGTDAFAPPAAPVVEPIGAVSERSYENLSDKDGRTAYWNTYVKQVTAPIEKRMREEMATIFGRQRREVLDNLAAYSDPIPEPEGPPVETKVHQGPLEPKDIAAVNIDLQQAVNETANALAPQIARTVVATGEEMASQFGIAFDASEPMWAQLVQQRTLTLSEISSFTSREVQRVIATGLENADTIETIQGEIRKLFNGMTRSRAQTIAVTEVNTAASDSRDQTFKNNGIPQTRWITARDNAVRHSHQINEGEIRNLGDLFPNGQERPLDGNGGGSNNINCRCVAVPVFDD